MFNRVVSMNIQKAFFKQTFKLSELKVRFSDGIEDFQGVFKCFDSTIRIISYVEYHKYHRVSYVGII